MPSRGNGKIKIVVRGDLEKGYFEGGINLREKKREGKYFMWAHSLVLFTSNSFNISKKRKKLPAC